MKEQKVIAVIIKDKNTTELTGLVPSGWRVVMISAMGGEGPNYSFAALVVIEKD